MKFARHHRRANRQSSRFLKAQTENAPAQRHLETATRRRHRHAMRRPMVPRPERYADGRRRTPGVRFTSRCFYCKRVQSCPDSMSATCQPAESKRLLIHDKLQHSAQRRACVNIARSRWLSGADVAICTGTKRQRHGHDRDSTGMICRSGSLLYARLRHVADTDIVSSGVGFHSAWSSPRRTWSDDRGGCYNTISKRRSAR